jgi:hypothetical protein
MEANPEKMNTITAMDTPRTIKEVHKLTGCMAALNRFMSDLEKEDYPSSNYSSATTSCSGPRRKTRCCKISSTICSHPPS